MRPWRKLKKTIEEKGGNFLLESNPTVLGENEKSIVEQLKEAAKNKEEEESEEEEEQEEGIIYDMPK